MAGRRHRRRSGGISARSSRTPNPPGWIEDLALPSPWPQVPLLRVVPSASAVSNREKAAEDHADIRLALALDGVLADVVVLDLPNRQGGPIIQNALTAATDILYAAKLDEDGLDGLDGAANAVRRFRDHRRRLGAPAVLREAGIVVGAVRDTIMTLDSKRALTAIEARYPHPLLRPLVPERVIVREARAAGDYHGFYDRGRLVPRHLHDPPAESDRLMTDTRPTPRLRPIPAPDEHQDPIDTPSPATPGAPATSAAGTGVPERRRGRSEPTVQLNVRVAEDIEQLLDHAANQLGWTKRQLVEQVIRTTYGTD